MSKKLKWMVKVISVFLCILLITEILPMQVFAENLNTVTEGTLTEPETETEKEKAVSPIVAEEESLREEYKKYFRCEDGSYMVAVYPDPVHYKENGVWEDIDNSLVASEGSKTDVFKDKVRYKTKKGACDISVPETLGGDNWISLSKGNYTVKLGLKQSQETKQTAEIKNEDQQTSKQLKASKKTTAQKNTEKMSLGKIRSSVTYQDVYDETDLEYIVSPYTVKEKKTRDL
ncbi:hypothetical protein SDC9_153196 [bioreactor metagenome]|uniref:Uncharacterized protein n=1 Tax=bioreactor metagenome TaxID=1076179 RepID=A0A645EXH7_9ZZZZ